MSVLLNESTVVEEYDFNRPDIHEIKFLLDDIFKNCRNKQFHTFEYRHVYDIKFTNISNKEEVKFTITHRFMEIKTEFYGLIKKSKTLEEVVIGLFKKN